MTIAISGVRAIAIDLDGTLLDTIPDLCSAVNRTLAELGFAELSLQVIQSFVGKGLGEHMRKSLLTVLTREPTADEKAHAIALYKKHYAAHIADQTRIYPGVVEGLDLFKARGLRMSVVTNKWTVYTETLLAYFKLAPYFDHLVCGDTLTTGKPDPGMMFYSAGRFGVHPREMLIIGDSGNDSRAAQAAGSPVVLMTYGYSEAENVVDLHANAIVGTFTDIPALLDT